MEPFLVCFLLPEQSPLSFQTPGLIRFDTFDLYDLAAF